ncbi:MAG: GTPase domain-containing protein [Desulfurobacteriaceae bacterium]
MGIYKEGNKEIHLKIVYWGSENSGKTENILKLSEILKYKGEIITLSTEEGKTIYFDFFSPTVSLQNGVKVKFLLYTSSGRKNAEANRGLVIDGTDGIVFVVDSEKDRIKDNKDSFEELKTVLKKKNLENIPIIVQYNKRDLPSALPVEVLRKELELEGYEEVEAIAKDGKGVEETFKKIAKLSLKAFLKKIQLKEEDLGNCCS